MAMAMKLTSTGGVKVVLLVTTVSASCTFRVRLLIPSLLSQVYNVTSSKSTPDWLKGKTKGSLRKDDEYRYAAMSRSRL